MRRFPLRLHTLSARRTVICKAMLELKIEEPNDACTRRALLQQCVESGMKAARSADGVPQSARQQYKSRNFFSSRHIFVCVLCMCLSWLIVVRGLTAPGDKQALLELFEQSSNVLDSCLAGSQWANATSDPCDDEWLGMVLPDGTAGCTGTRGMAERRVLRLSLPNCNLNGQIPGASNDAGSLSPYKQFNSEVSRGLQHAYAGQLVTAAPVGFAALTEIQYVDLSRNALSSGIPENLDQLVAVEHLNLSHNHLHCNGKNVDVFTRITSLRQLDISWNNFICATPIAIGNLVRVETLNIAYSGLHHSIPYSVQDMTSLQYFNFDGVVIWDLNSIASYNFPALTKLYARHAEMSGTFPDFTRTPTLEFLDVSFNSLSLILPDPYAPPGTSSIQHIVAKNNFMNRLPEYFSELATLISADFSHNSITGPGVANVQWPWRLQALNLSSNQITSMAGSNVFKHEQLQILDLSSNAIQDNFPDISHMFNLEKLNLSRNSLQGPLFQACTPHSSLRVLDLSHNRLKGFLSDCIGNLRALEILDLSFNDLEGRIPVGLGQLTNLRVLKLNGNQLTGELDVGLSNLTMLEVLDLGGNDFYGELPPDMADLQHLQLVNLSGSSLTGQIAANASFMLNGVIVDFRGNQLSGPLPASTNQLGMMKHLDLGYNRFSGPVPASILGAASVYIDFSCNQFSGKFEYEGVALPNLHALLLANNSLSGAAPNIFSQTPALVALDLSMNRFNGPIPDSIGDAANLTILRLSFSGFNGVVPQSLGQLQRVKLVDLSGNSFQELDTDLFCGMENLVELYLSAVYDAPAFGACIGELQHLLGLDLSFNGYSGAVPSWLADLKTLQVLSLSNNHFTELGALAFPGWDRLEVLDLGGNAFTDLNFPAGSTSNGLLENLVRLDVSNNALTSLSVSSWSSLGSLEILDASNNPISDCFSINLGGLQSLQTLSLKNCKLSCSSQGIFAVPSSTVSLDVSGNVRLSNVFDSLARLSQLESLQLSETNVGEVSSSIGQLTQLKYLLAQSSGISGKLPTELGALWDLEILDLSRNSISGSLPSSLGSLISLKVADFSNNALSGQIPDSVGQLSALSKLDLSNNHISGGVPDTFARLEQLTTLNLASNQLTDANPSMLGNLPNLFTLILTANRLAGDIKDFVSLPHVSDLEVNDNRLTGDLSGVFVGQQSNLSELYIGGNPINISSNSLGSLVQIPHLYILNMSGLDLSAVLFDDFACLPNLLAIMLSDCKLKGSIDTITSFQLAIDINLENNMLTGELPDRVTEMHHLNLLLVRNNSISGILPENLGNIQLEYLDFGYNQLTGNLPLTLGSSISQAGFGFNSFSGTIPTSYCSLTSLRMLSAPSNLLHGSIPDCFQSLASLTVLNLENNTLSGQLPNGIGQLQRLQMLSLSGNNFSGTLPSSIWELKSLQTLNLHSNSLVGALPEAVSQLTALEVLMLSNNQFTGPLPSSLGNLESLLQLGLESNKFSGRIPDTFDALGSCVQLNLSNNSFSGFFPTSIARMKSLQVLVMVQIGIHGRIPSFEGLTDLVSITLGPNVHGALFVEPGSTMKSHFGSSSGLALLSWFNVSFPYGFLSDVPYLPKLTLLQMSESGVSGLVANNWDVKFPSLTQLLMWGGKLSGPMPKLPAGMKVVVLVGNAFSSLSPLDHAHALEYVVLDGNRNMTGSIPANFTPFSNLRVFSVQHCALSGSVPASLYRLSYTGRLETLRLQDNLFRGNLELEREEFYKVCRLKHFDVSKNLLSGTAKTTFMAVAESCPHLSVLQAEQNLLTCSLRSEDLSRLSQNPIDYFSVLDGNHFHCPVPATLAKTDPGAESYTCDSSPLQADFLASAAAFLLCVIVAAWQFIPKCQEKPTLYAQRLWKAGAMRFACLLALAACLSCVHWAALHPSMLVCPGALWGAAVYHADLNGAVLFLVLFVLALSLTTNIQPALRDQSRLRPAEKVRSHATEEVAPLPVAYSRKKCALHWLGFSSVVVGFCSFNLFIDIALALVASNTGGIRDRMRLPHAILVLTALSSLLKLVVNTVLLPRSAFKCLRQPAATRPHSSITEFNCLPSPAGFIAAMQVFLAILCPLIVALIQLNECFEATMPWATKTHFPVEFSVEECSAFCVPQVGSTKLNCPHHMDAAGCSATELSNVTLQFASEPLWRGTCASAAFSLFAPQAALLLATTALQLLCLTVVQSKTGRTIGQLTGALKHRACVFTASATRCLGISFGCTRDVLNSTSAQEHDVQPSAKRSGLAWQLELAEPLVDQDLMEGYSQPLMSGDLEQPVEIADGGHTNIMMTKENTQLDESDMEMTFEGIQANVAMLLGAVFGSVYPAASVACVAAVSAHLFSWRWAPHAYMNDAPVPRWMHSTMLVTFTASSWFAFGPGSLFHGKSADVATVALSLLTAIASPTAMWLLLPQGTQFAVKTFMKDRCMALRCDCAAYMRAARLPTSASQSPPRTDPLISARRGNLQLHWKSQKA